MDKRNKSKWTNKFRALGRKKGSRQDFIMLYREMKIEKDNKDNKDNKTDTENWKDLVKDNEKKKLQS